MNQSKKIKIIVNIMSLLRIAMIPVLYVIEPKVSVLAFFIVVNALFITDFFDGYLARKYNATSDMGALLDLLGDKLLVVYLMLWALFTNKLGFLIVILVIVREVLSMVIRFIKNKNEHSTNSIPASYWGKFKTCMQFISIDMLLLTIPGYKIGFLIVIILGYYSLFNYFKIFLRKD